MSDLFHTTSNASWSVNWKMARAEKILEDAMNARSQGNKRDKDILVNRYKRTLRHQSTSWVPSGPLWDAPGPSFGSEGFGPAWFCHPAWCVKNSTRAPTSIWCWSHRNLCQNTSQVTALRWVNDIPNWSRDLTSSWFSVNQISYAVSQEQFTWQLQTEADGTYSSLCQSHTEWMPPWQLEKKELYRIVAEK